MAFSPTLRRYKFSARLIKLATILVLLRVAGIVRDAYDYNINDDNFRRAKKEKAGG
ncbi:MAG: hypothetical protein LBP89_08300 [Helicobacteraceae bacterium]|nr:hypothetical protein [Helicobacteraceae bacterium]